MRVRDAVANATQGERKEEICERIAKEAKVHRTVVNGARQLVVLFFERPQPLERGFPLC